MEPFQQENKGKKSVDIVSDYTGISTGQLSKEKVIVQAAREDPDKFGKLLEKVDNGKVSIDYAYDSIKRSEYHKAENIPPLPEGKYDIILADPPWPYEFDENRGSASSHYNIMSIEDICNVKVPSADNGTVLFLWSTSTQSDKAHEVLKAWGFNYKTQIVYGKKIKLEQVTMSGENMSYC